MAIVIVVVVVIVIVIVFVTVTVTVIVIVIVFVIVVVVVIVIVIVVVAAVAVAIATVIVIIGFLCSLTYIAVPLKVMRLIMSVLSLLNEIEQQIAVKNHESSKYLLLTEFEGRTVSYGSSFFLLDLWSKREL